MTNRHLRTFAAIIAVMGAYITAAAQIPEGYYDSLKGKSGAELKNAVHNIIKNVTVYEYGSGRGKTWWGFWQTDRTEDGRFIDRYSPEDTWPQSTTQGKAGAGMNIEHSFPKSWWGKTENQAYKDLYNLMPCESGINTKKSNYPMGKVVNADLADNGATKVGKGANGKNLWEPADEWKGDFARGYMYMATCYQDFQWVGTGLQILEQGDYPTLQEWAYKLYIEWAKADKPTELEIVRNQTVSKIQGNRNPFVDFPNLMEYIWGDSINYAFDPMKTVCTTTYSGDDTPVEPGGESVLVRWNFVGNECGFTIEDIVKPIKYVWLNTETSGWKGSAYTGKANATDSYLVSPEIDLTGFTEANFYFKHSVNYARTDKVTDRLGVEVRCDGQTTQMGQYATWPDGTNWDRLESGNIPLNDFLGKKIKIAYHYTSTNDIAMTWYIYSMYLNGKKATTGIESTAATTAEAAAEAYTIDGQRISAPAAYRGIMVMKQGGKTWKVAR